MRRAASLACALSFAMILSCSEIPTAPRIAATVFVSGRITDRDGPPLAGVSVAIRLETSTSGLPTYWTTTDADGRYTAKVVEGIYRIGINPPYRSGYPDVDLPGVKVGSRGATVDYRYTGVRVTGSITGPNAAPLSGAEVYAYRTSGGGSNASGHSTAGQYTMLIPAGVYDFVASSGGFDEDLPRIALRNIAIAADTTIDFSLSGFAVAVTLTLFGSTPMIGGQISATNDAVSSFARTGLDGTASLYLPAGSYVIRASPFPYNVVGPQLTTRSIQADDALAFDFSGPEWSVTIRRASDSTPITGAWARLVDGENGTAGASTDGFGRCTFLVRPGTTYTLGVEWIEGIHYRAATVTNLFSAADTTFDLSVTTSVP